MDDALIPEEVLSLKDVPRSQTETISKGMIAPMRSGADMACGVFRPDGSFCELSRTMRSVNRFTGIPECPEHGAVLSGRHLFAGIGRHHFGHFLLECVSRLWPLHHDSGYDGLVIVPKPDINFEAVFQRRFGAFLDVLTGGLPVHFVTSPLQVETLVVPTQGIGHLHWSRGTDEFRHFVRSRIEEQVMPKGSDLLYISRTQLKRKEQMVDQEERIETLMVQAGYEIFHPQKHSLVEQCARYMAASHIVGADGSAFHLVPFAIRPGTTVGIIQRRDRSDMFRSLLSQIRAFCDVDLIEIDALAQASDSETRQKDYAAIDFETLQTQLDDAGLI